MFFIMWQRHRDNEINLVLKRFHKGNFNSLWHITLRKGKAFSAIVTKQINLG
jgi:hypothetical protein